MVKGGWRRVEAQDEETPQFRFVYTNKRLETITKTASLRNFIDEQYLRYTGHLCRAENYNLPKIMLFAEATKKNFQDPWKKIAKLLGVSIV